MRLISHIVQVGTPKACSEHQVTPIISTTAAVPAGLRFIFQLRQFVIKRAQHRHCCAASVRCTTGRHTMKAETAVLIFRGNTGFTPSTTVPTPPSRPSSWSTVRYRPRHPCPDRALPLPALPPYLPDLPYGQSQVHNSHTRPISREEEADILLELIEHFACDLVLSFSWGGIATLRARPATAAHPQSGDQLVLAGDQRRHAGLPRAWPAGVKRLRARQHRRPAQ